MTQAQVLKLLQRNPMKWFTPKEMEDRGVCGASCALRKIMGFYPEVEREKGYTGRYRYNPERTWAKLRAGELDELHKYY